MDVHPRMTRFVVLPVLEVRAVQGKVYVDGSQMDAIEVAAATAIVTVTATVEGWMA